MEIPFKKKKTGISLQVKVNPRTSRRRIAGVRGETVLVDLTAPPVEGAANEQLKEVLSESLGVRKSSIHIVRGGTSRHKVVEIEGVEDL